MHHHLPVVAVVVPEELVLALLVSTLPFRKDSFVLHLLAYPVVVEELVLV